MPLLKQDQFYFFIRVLILGFTFLGPVAAHARPGIPQTPQSILVNYAVQNKELILMLSTRPPISGCGKISNLPIGGGFDTNAIDLQVGAYTFTPAKYNVHGPACGPTYKMSIARVAIPLADLESKKINRIRLWSGTNLDTFLITNDDSHLTLSQIPGARFFKLGNYLLQVPDSFKRLASQNQ